MYQKNVGAYYHLGLSQAMVSYSIQEVTEALNQRALLEKYIKFPKTPIEREIISKRYPSYIILTNNEYLITIICSNMNVKYNFQIRGTFRAPRRHRGH